MVEVDPLTQQILGLLMQAGRIVKLACLYDARVHHRWRSNANTIDQRALGILPQCLQQRCQSEPHTQSVLV